MNAFLEWKQSHFTSPVFQFLIDFKASIRLAPIKIIFFGEFILVVNKSAEV